MGIELNSDQIFAYYEAERWWNSASSGQIFEISGAAGTGKAQPLDTVIPTPDGNKLLGDLKVGDYVFNRYGKPVEILGVFDQGELDAFEVTLDDGRSTICNNEHLWSYYVNGYDILETNTLNYLMNEGLVTDDGNYKYQIPSSELYNTSDVKGNYICSVRDLGYKTQMRCIYVDDPEHLYLTNDYIVTHNTTSIRYILQQLGLDPLHDVLFVAFTGKAATQLARNGLPAITCHSAFYEYKKEIERDENNKIVLTPNGKPKLKGVFKKKDHIKKRYKAICIDEATMINEQMKEDIMSFGLPIFALGDMNQLPPVFGKPVFLVEPDVTLRKLMRQAEDSPIVYIAHRILDGYDLRPGIYGNSAILRKKDLNQFQLKNADVVLTVTNSLKQQINTLFREEYLNYKRLDLPYVGEKVICKKNDWSKSIGENLFLTNGTTGFIEYVDRESYNGRSIEIDFRPDFTPKTFRNLPLDYNNLMNLEKSETQKSLSFGLNLFEFAYAITVYASQGSQWENVTALAELYGSDDFQKKVLYTMVTRASKSITLAI